MDRTPPLSRVARSMRPGVFAVLEARIAEATARGTRIVPLHIGDTCRPPPAAARFGAIVGERDDAPLYAYGATAGEAALKEAVARRAVGRGLGWVTPRNVMVGVGGTHALACAAHAILDPGDEVILLSPYWPLAPGIFHAVGAATVEVAASQRLYADPGFDLGAALRAALGPRTRAVYFVSPNNPDGKILGERELVQIARFAEEHDLWVFADEVYADITYGAPPPSFGALEGMPGLRSRSIVLHSLSKSHALAGARVGYFLGPEEVIAAALRFSTHSAFNVPLVCQRAALAALESEGAWLAESLVAYRAARDAVVARLAAGGIPTHVPEGGTYVFVDLAESLRGRTLVQLLERAIDLGVLVTPGVAFGEAFPSHARVCFTSAPEADVLVGIDRLLRAAAGE